MNNFGQHSGSRALDSKKDDGDMFWQINNKPKATYFDEKKALVYAEMNRLSKLPPNSSYAQHRSRVLSKLLHLMSIQRTATQDEELELLFAGLSL